MRLMQAGEFGNFPHLQLGLGWGLRICEVSAAPRAAPPEFASSSFTARFKYERNILSTRFSLHTMRIAMIQDVDATLVACPQAGHCATTYCVSSSGGRAYGRAFASLRPQAGSWIAGMINHDVAPVTLGSCLNALRVPSASDDTTAFLSRFRAPPLLPWLGRVEGNVHVHPGMISAIASVRVLLRAIICPAANLAGYLSCLAGSTRIDVVNRVLSVLVPPLGTLRWFRSPQPLP